MRRLLPFIPLFIFVFLNACNGIATGIPPDQWNSMAETLTATSWTPIPTQTFNPNIPHMINWLNNDLSTVSPLGRTLDADYHVTNISFPNRPKSPALIFRVDVGCICMNKTECCTPERTFVVIIESMKRNSGIILALAPSGISEIMVVCSDYQTRAQIGAIAATWQDVDGYLREYLSGDQLGVRATRTAAP